MSRTVHRLLSVSWWGGWAQMFRLDNRELQRRTRRKRAADRARVDATADLCACCTCRNGADCESEGHE